MYIILNEIGLDFGLACIFFTVIFRNKRWISYRKLVTLIAYGIKLLVESFF